MAYEKENKSRFIDGNGRIVVPKKLRNHLNFTEETEIEFSIENNAILLKRAPTCCAICNSTTDIMEEFRICKSCAKAIAEKINEN